MTVTDIVGNPLRANDLIAYPTRQGTTMHQIIARVIEVHTFTDAVGRLSSAELLCRPVQRGGERIVDARCVVVRSLQRVVRVYT